jgi:hypothetical protein
MVLLELILICRWAVIKSLKFLYFNSVGSGSHFEYGFSILLFEFRRWHCFRTKIYLIPTKIRSEFLTLLRFPQLIFVNAHQLQKIIKNSKIPESYMEFHNLWIPSNIPPQNVQNSAESRTSHPICQKSE